MASFTVDDKAKLCRAFYNAGDVSPVDVTSHCGARLLVFGLSGILEGKTLAACGECQKSPSLRLWLRTARQESGPHKLGRSGAEVLLLVLVCPCRQRLMVSRTRALRETLTAHVR